LADSNEPMEKDLVVVEHLRRDAYHSLEKRRERHLEYQNGYKMIMIDFLITVFKSAVPSTVLSTVMDRFSIYEGIQESKIPNLNDFN
jgi:hypothetical protein